ncbi:ABC transporter ATP-binding protein [Phreatobacter sp. AB_2022a]|uniref:ABC transporter ATP-binding protein n=1 Tax=Phreatobacter sp. AB_2022a TaxID=3003134 RepID=UPI000579AD3D|nr:ABC transporter ATP-binding protein [Phreatobacter sp. AB_2022a]MCZ0732906.1 ABC transporter ATP-binding protein [Phreatobacter sp. AB_2022a]CEJ10475.1 Oligopeptide transport ATP-binding protein OppD [bacterium YEK0313]
MPDETVTAADVVLDVRDLKTHFKTERGFFRAVDGVSFQVARGRTLAVVGESGCGKSVTSLSIMGLVPEPPGIKAGGEILFEGQDLLTKTRAELEEIRGARIAMIFQEPMTSLNPVYRVGDQIVEGLVKHRGLSARAARERAIEMLRLVRIPSPETRVDAYPHEMSGGMRQRVMIAIALACEPQVLIADEPTTALDVTIQAQVLDLMRDLKSRLGTAIILITHDLGVVAEMADDVVVMYAGKVVERASVAALFDDAQHPYTLGLLASVPRLDADQERLQTIEGMVPTPETMPTGCRFAPRCTLASDRCLSEMPPLRDIRPGHQVACWKAPIDEVAA